MYRSVAGHYGKENLKSVILAALAASGKDPDKLTSDDLAPVDEFHIRGRQATRELAVLAGLNRGCKVLDVGCGIGGPSRCLALEFGCTVTGLDLTEEFCQLAQNLAERLNLDDKLYYCHANALDIPFADSTFDVVWSQHAAMNIHDKDRLYAGMARVLKPGGVMAINDILASSGGAVLYPVPWAKDSSISFLSTTSELRDHIENAGFKITKWNDTTAKGLEWFQRMMHENSEKGAGPLGIHLLLGPDARDMMSNIVRNLAENRIAIVEVVARLE